MERRSRHHPPRHKAARAEATWLGRAVRAREPVGPATPRTLRRPLDYQAVLNFGSTESIACRVRDMSTSGAFVAPMPPGLGVGQAAEFVLRWHYKGAALELRLPATVTRTAPEGVGLRFGRYDSQAYTHLVNLLYAM